MTSPKLSFALQMDPVAGIDITGDSTFALGLEAQSRGPNLWSSMPENLPFTASKETARGQSPQRFPEVGAPFQHGPTAPQTLRAFHIRALHTNPHLRQPTS